MDEAHRKHLEMIQAAAAREAPALMPDAPPTWFLSYAGEDRPLARALFDGLRAAGLRLFCDVDRAALPPGATWV